MLHKLMIASELDGKDKTKQRSLWSPRALCASCLINSDARLQLSAKLEKRCFLTGVILQAG